MTKIERRRLIGKTCLMLKKDRFIEASLYKAYLGNLNEAEIKLINIVVDDNDNSGGLIK